MAGNQALVKKPKFKGELLLCEDNDINQFTIKSLLNGLGFNVVIAENGAVGVTLVSDRMKKGELPFDLILMDIYMPVMDGLEAADSIIAMGCKTPIVALTASTSPEETAVYRNHGMPDFLSKPLPEEELLTCIKKYFTPQSYVVENENKQSDDEEEKRLRLLTGFVKRNRTTYAEMSAALETGDIKLAHRLAHTLRGLAGLMGKTALQEASKVLENSLANNKMENINEEMLTLKNELTPVLEELMPLLDEQKPSMAAQTAFDKDKALEIFERLEPMLKADSAACLDFVAELRTIPGTEELIGQIDDYEFETALETLMGIKGSWR